MVARLDLGPQAAGTLPCDERMFAVQATPRRGTAPPMLIIVSDEHEVGSALRAGRREVWRWLDGSGPAPAHGHHFSGDPTAAETYRWAAAASDVSAVVELASPDRARAVAAAIRDVREDAAVLLLCDRCTATHADGTLARAGRIRDVLRIDVDEELRWLEAQRKAYCLRHFAEAADTVPILIHDDPDPDALSSALAARVLLRRPADETPIVTLGGITRPENRRMAELLHLRVTEVSLAELRRFERIIVLDSQPRAIGGGPRFAVIDHHPLDGDYDADYLDVRPEIGATASMLTQYLRADDPRRVGAALATALLYGIRTDTDSLSRGVAPIDVEQYAFLQERVDRKLLLRIERPSYRLDTARVIGGALSNVRQAEDVAVAYLGALHPDDGHCLADVADFCLALDQVNWSGACAFVEDSFVMSLRHVGNLVGAGSLARSLAEAGGSGGGHESMARVTIPADALRAGRGIVADHDDVADAVLRWVLEALEGLRSDQSSSASPSSAGA
jgi:nanoRNase/pAp phosphatase (c-di-AMP/oligoRNAs hydrolase)